MDEIRIIKKLQTQLRKLDEEIHDIHNVMSEWQRNYDVKKRDKLELINKIEEMKKGELKVTEHAMLRYFERVLGYDLESIETKMIECVPNSQKTVGNGSYPCEGFKAVIKENTIITITI